MPLPFVESKPISLRAAGYDEKWVQDAIYKDPSVLGLGDLKPLTRELRQSTGGRLDLLLADLESDIVYEVELMLGATDESHIIRTIEYWDIESRRRPDKEHRAVIVAEEITNRFFNVIWILSRSIPIIAIKLDALEVDGKLVISYTKVLDVYETPEAGDVSSVPSTRQSWVDYSRKESFEVFEKIVEVVSSSGISPKVTYTTGYIALGGVKRNYAWFSPQSKGIHCMVELRVGEKNLDEILKELNDAGVNGYRFTGTNIRMRITTTDLTSKSAIIRKALDTAIEEGDAS